MARLPSKNSFKLFLHKSKSVATPFKSLTKPSLLQLSQMLPVWTQAFNMFITEVLTLSNRMASLGNSFFTSSLPMNNGSKYDHNR